MMWSIDELQDAWKMAADFHEGQKYGGQREGKQVEYINHIGSVTFEILTAVIQTEILDADLAIKCAILHDTLEDTPLTYGKVKEKFGEQVAQGVLALTKNEDIHDKELKMKDTLNRIKLQPKAVWAVKMADRISNLQQPPFHWTNEKKAKYREEASLIYQELKEGNTYLASRLRQKIEAYQQYIT